MPSVSVKVKWNLETLQQQALENIDVQIAKQREEVERLKDPNHLMTKVAEWRAIQEFKVTDLYNNLSTLDDQQLSHFRIDPMPVQDRSVVRQAQNRLRDLEELRGRILAKSGSLVTDEDGNISLTKTQLREFFGL